MIFEILCGRNYRSNYFSSFICLAVLKALKSSSLGWFITFFFDHPVFSLVWHQEVICFPSLAARVQTNVIPGIGLAAYLFFRIEICVMSFFSICVNLIDALIFFINFPGIISSQSPFCSVGNTFSCFKDIIQPDRLLGTQMFFSLNFVWHVSRRWSGRGLGLLLERFANRCFEGFLRQVMNSTTGVLSYTLDEVYLQIIPCWLNLWLGFLCSVQPKGILLLGNSLIRRLFFGLYCVEAF